MWEAHRLLVESGLPLRRVAQVVGVPSYSTFWRLFRGKFGKTPTLVRLGARAGELTTTAAIEYPAHL